MPGGFCFPGQTLGGEVNTAATNRMTAEERRERQKESRRKHYENLTPEQREQKRAHDREYVRKRRAALREAKQAAAASAPASAVETSAPVPAPMTPIAPRNVPKLKSKKPAEPAVKAQDLESYGDLSPHKAKTFQKVWRAEVSEYLLDAITRPESPFSGAGLRASKMLCFWFNFSEKLDRIVDQEKPGQTEEFTLAVMLECLRRLTGGGKTAAAPTLQEIAQKLA
jgi:hypothetical protein